MADYRTIARPYAKAAYEVAVQANAVAEWEAFLSQLAVWAEGAEARALLFHPKVSADQLADALIVTLDQELTAEMRNFLLVLGENQRLAILPDVAILFRAQQSTDNAKVAAVLTTATKLSQQQCKAFESALAAKWDCAVEMQHEVDEDLLGGAVVRVGDWVLDGSIRGKLKRLAKVLTA